MAVILYKIGTQQEINGLQCDVLRLDPKTFNGQLIPGWFFSPKDAYAELEPELIPDERENPEEIEVSPEIIEESHSRLEEQQKEIDRIFNETEEPEIIEDEEEKAKEEPKAEDKAEKEKVLRGNAKIRDNARKAGIEDWEKARIATLKEKLKA